MTPDNHLTTFDNSLLSEPINSLPEAVSPAIGEFLEASLSANTRRAYRTDMEHFTEWGGSLPSSPETIARYLAEHARCLSVATLSRRLVSIGKAHTMAGYTNPASSDLVKLTMRGIRRTCGKPQDQVAPVLKEDLIAMVSHMGESMKDVRDRALLLIGFAGAFRRSELVSINYDNIEHVSRGVIIHLPRSKTDQEGQGRKIAIPYARGALCPVLALKAWLEKSGIVEEAVFRPVDRHGKIRKSRLSKEAVAIVIKERANIAGLDSTRYSGHSLRAGLATSAAAVGVSSHKIRQQTGHTSDAMLSRYIRDGELFRDNAAGLIFYK